MSSTEGAGRSRLDDRERTALKRFFERRILPLAGSPGWERSDAAPDPAAASYWRELDGEPMAPADFELCFGDPRAVGRSLDALWRGTPLAGLGRRLARLARRFERREEQGEVSSDVYEMF